MKNLDLNNYGVQEMNAGEMSNVDGGIVPLILACWGIMLVCDVITAGMYYGYHSNR